MARIAIIGGGINGVMTAWELTRRGHAVALFERDTLMAATSSNSSKLLHGGLRYLENGEWALVKKALADRAWWLQHAPSQKLAHHLPIVWPLYQGARRGRWMIKLGLWFYDRLASAAQIGRHSWQPAQDPAFAADGLRSENLLGGYGYWDGQMDDAALGLWAAEQARAAGAELLEYMQVARIGLQGSVQLVEGGEERFDAVVNAAGPWAESLLRSSGVTPVNRLDIVRGSHILLDRKLQRGYLLEVPGERRVVFVLPYQGKTLVGTTEVRQNLSEPVVCSAEEESYLLSLYNHYFAVAATSADICGRFAGLRPLIYSARDPNQARRDYVFESHGRVLTVFGGKWTTAPSLAREAATLAESLCRP